MKKTTNKATIKHLYGVNANKVPNRTYRLPNGTYTTSHKKYLETWTKIGEEFGKIIDGTLFGFDPDFVYRVNGNVNSETFNPFTVVKILQAISSSSIKGYLEGQHTHRDYSYYNYY